MREFFELKVHLAHDEETDRWYVAESDIPGLWLEADSPTDLMERIQIAAPELIELNVEEIVQNCRARDALVKPIVRAMPVAAPTRHAIRPVFDSPFLLANA